MVIACSSDGSSADGGGYCFGPSVDDNVVADLVHSVKLREDVLRRSQPNPSQGYQDLNAKENEFSKSILYIAEDIPKVLNLETTTYREERYQILRSDIF